MIPSSFVLGLLAGGAVGGTAALLLTQERGSDLRRRAGVRVRPVVARVSSVASGLAARIRAPPPEGPATNGEW